jgi:hypothetical protein
MAIVSALVFASALALIVAVIAGTLVPAWDRIIAALASESAPQPRLLPARRLRGVRQDLRAADRAVRWREAA